MPGSNPTANQPSGGSEMPAPSEAVQPVVTSTPSTPDELAQARQHIERLQQQVRGSSSYVEMGRKLGFTSEEDFKRMAPLVSAIRERKIDPSAIVGLLSPQPPHEAADAMERIDPDRIKSEIMRDVSAQLAEQQWSSSVTNEVQAIDNRDRLRSVIGESVPDKVLDVLAGAAMMHYMGLRQPFDDSHPLRGRLAPLGSDNMAKVDAYVKQAYTNIKAAVLESIGNTQRRKPSTTPAGNSSTSGSAPPSNRPVSAESLIDEGIKELAASIGS